MPGYPWLNSQTVDPELVTKKLRVLQLLGDPYTDEQIASAAAEVDGETVELDRRWRRAFGLRHQTDDTATVSGTSSIRLLSAHCAPNKPRVDASPTRLPR